MMPDDQESDTGSVDNETTPGDSMPHEPVVQAFAAPPPAKKMSWGLRNTLMSIGALVFIGSIVGSVMFLTDSNSLKQAVQEATGSSTSKDNAALQSSLEEVEGMELDTSKDYGNKYGDGILPVGDEQYATSGATKGKVYLCRANFVPDEQAGATTRGPWFIGTTRWDINKKYSVSGSVSWEQNLTNTIEGSKRVITTNNLPDHKTGVFPVSVSDPAYQFDRNPNTISSQSLTYELDASPEYGEPNCMGGEAGVMLTGVALFNAFDAGGRDAGAWEIQDACEGHPQSSGIYHYHTLSSCVTDIDVTTVIGFALDGFPITGPKVGDNNILTTDDLDECHGLTSEIALDGKKITTYHYVMTQDFPYSVSCFRGNPIDAPGQHTGGNQTEQQPSGTQQPATSGQAPGQPPTGQKPPKP